MIGLWMIFILNKKGRCHILFCAKLFVLLTTNIAAHIGLNMYIGFLVC